MTTSKVTFLLVAGMAVWLVAPTSAFFFNSYNRDARASGSGATCAGKVTVLEFCQCFTWNFLLWLPCSLSFNSLFTIRKYIFSIFCFVRFDLDTSSSFSIVCTVMVGLVDQLAVVHHESNSAAFKRLCATFPQPYSRLCNTFRLRYGFKIVRQWVRYYDDKLDYEFCLSVLNDIGQFE